MDESRHDRTGYLSLETPLRAMAELRAAPVLSTPAENLLERSAELAGDGDGEEEDVSQAPRRSDDELRDVYEVARTARAIRAGGRRRVALQFPDAMLGDSPRVAQLLQDELAAEGAADGTAEGGAAPPAKVYILADTSYGACCVDEIAAEHADADVVVHYGRACLSPTSRLPVEYVFTRHALDVDAVVAAFVRERPDAAATRAVVMADVTYQDHVAAVAGRLRARGYEHVLATSVVHRPRGAIPNRALVRVDGDGRVTETVEGGEGEGEETTAGATGAAGAAVDLRTYAVFHIAQPPKALLLALAARVQAFYVYPTRGKDAGAGLLAPRTLGLLGRRYAKVLTMATAGVIGILVNTLSVRHYRAAVDALRRRIAAAGKKSYVLVVGKLTPAKLANFGEIDGWVVVGCWESSLVEDDAGFYRPVVTPFELDMALLRDDERVWGHKWWGGLEALVGEGGEGVEARTTNDSEARGDGDDDDDVSDEEDSEVPQFDLRTGRLVTTSRPMRIRGHQAETAAGRPSSTAAGGGAGGGGQLSLRPKAELATVNGVVSPGAEFLRSQRTWQGLGSDFRGEDDDAVASTALEEGRSGIARGYTVGDDTQRT